RILICGFALMMVIESLSQRVESDEAMHARAVPAAGDPGHDVDLLVYAQLILVLEPFGKIDDPRRHQHDPRLLSYLAMQLVKLLGERVGIGGTPERTANVTAERVVPRITSSRYGVGLERRQPRQRPSVSRCQVSLAEFLVYLLIQK